MEFVGITRVWVQARQDPVWKLRNAKEIKKGSNKCLSDAFLTASAKVKAPGKGVNDAGSKALKEMRGGVNKSSLESGSLDAVLIAAPEVHTPEKGVNDAGQKASKVVQAPRNGSQEAIL